VDAEERRRKRRLWYRQNFVPISELTDEDAEERRRKQKLNSNKPMTKKLNKEQTQ
jgi:hypothetical protein